MIGKRLGAGAVQGIKEERLDSLIEKVVNRIVVGSRNILLSKQTTEQIDALLDSLSQTLVTNIENMTISVRDSLLNEYTTLKVKRFIIGVGGGVTEVGEQLMDELLGKKALDLIIQLRGELLGDSTLMAVGLLRDELLGEKTKALVDSLLVRSIAIIARDFKQKIVPELNQFKSETEKAVKGIARYIAWVLGILGVVLAVVIFLIWRKMSRRTRILSIVTRSIDKIDNQDEYDDLVKRIRAETEQAALEPEFREVLVKDQLLDQKHWIDHELLKLVSTAYEKQANEENLVQLKEQMAEKGLLDQFQQLETKT